MISRLRLKTKLTSTCRKVVSSIYSTTLLPNETEYAYLWRLGRAKDDGLLEMNWDEIADLMNKNFRENDMEFAESAYRKVYTSAKKVYESGAFGVNTANEIEKERIDAKIEELQKEKKKYYDQRREYTKFLTAESRWEHLLEVIKECANNMPVDFYETIPVRNDSNATLINDAVIVFGDWHYGLKTSNVFNEYNVEICKHRVQKTVAEMIKRIEFHKCETAHIVVLGDLFHGAVHVSARVASEEVVCEQIMHVSEILANAIYEISKHVSKVDVYLTYGNHARTVQNKKDSIHSDNMERIILWWLQERFNNNPKINIKQEKSNIDEFILLNVFGYTFCATHGDLDSIIAAPRLFSTLFSKKYGCDIDYVLLGDKHHRESFNELGITSFLCGSLCGTDDYANEKRLFSDPSQLLLIVNSECGVDAEYRIKGN